MAKMLFFDNKKEDDDPLLSRHLAIVNLSMLK